MKSIKYWWHGKVFKILDLLDICSNFKNASLD